MPQYSEVRKRGRRRREHFARQRVFVSGDARGDVSARGVDGDSVAAHLLGQREVGT